MNMPQHQKIVILGAGFAGLGVAHGLARLLPHDDDGEIMLVDQHNYTLFTPLLTEVVGGQVDSRHVVASIRRLSPRIRFLQGRVDGIDIANKRVTITVGGVEPEVPAEQQTLEAGHLVIALGSVTNYHHVQGVREHALTVKSVGDAMAIRNRALALLERADAEPDSHVRKELLTFIVAGGGFSGVETMAALNGLVRDVAKNYPRVRSREIRTLLVHPGERLLPELGEALASYAQKQLERRRVEVMLQTEMTGADGGSVEVKAHGGQPQHIPTHLVVWAAGGKPSPVIGKLDAKRGHHGGVVVDGCCAVEGHPGVWALGDCAEVPEPQSKKSYAPTAQNAIREGTRVAQNIVAVLNGAKPEPFTYHPIGEFAIVGRRAGVASIYGVHIAGPLAWIMWRGIYLAKMPRFAKRLRVGFDWLLDLAFGRDLVEIPVEQTTGQTVSPARPGATTKEGS